MGHRERAGRILGMIAAGLGLALLGLGLFAPLVVARGLDGSPRSAMLDLALVLLDPMTGRGWLASVAAAGVTALIAWMVGVPFGRVIGRRRFVGRGVLARLALATVAVPPLLGALGLRLLIGEANLDATEPFAGIGLGWLALVWVEVACLTPLVAVAVARGVSHLEPSWEEAGRASGATARRAWRDLAWPQVRPASNRAVATVFALSLLDPGAPLALGLERSLPVQIVRAATIDAAPTRAAALALVGLATALTVGLALRGRRGWGDAHRFDRESPRVPGLAAGWSRGLVFLGLLAAWAAFAWLPILALSQPILERFSAGGTSTGLGRSVLAAVREPRWLEPVVWGAIVGTLAVASSFGLARWGAGRAGRVALWVGRWVPPLVLAVGLLGAGPILVGLSEWIGGLASLGKVGRLVDPYATSGTALLIGLTLLHLPRAVAATAAAKARCAPELVEAGVTLGASPRQARRDLQRPLTAPTRLRAGLLIGVLAAADFGLALPLVPVSRPSLPTVSVLDHFDQVGGRLPSAALGLAIAVVAAGAWIAGGPIERRPEP